MASITQTGIIKSIKRGWKKRAITKHLGTPVYLETLEGYFIQPKKLNLETMQELTMNGSFEIDPDELAGKSEEEIKKIFDKKGAKKNISLSDKRFKTMIKLAVLNGIYDHNFNKIVDVNDVEVSSESLDKLSEEEFDKEITEGTLKNVKQEWDENFYKAMEEYAAPLLEIFKIVMDFNRPLSETTPETKSEK